MNLDGLIVGSKVLGCIAIGMVHQIDIAYAGVDYPADHRPLHKCGIWNYRWRVAREDADGEPCFA